LGLAARRYCVRHGMRFTTSYHTQFPQYLRARFRSPWAGPMGAALVPRRRGALHGQHRLRAQGLEFARFREPGSWRRGVDTELFKPGAQGFSELPRPIAAYVGRVAVEKNIDAFLQMPWSGSKIVIGDGPERARLQTSIRRRTSRVSLRRGPREAPRGRRRHGVSEPHRYLRARESRGDGLRRAGRRVSGHRADRRDRGRRHRRARYRPGAGRPSARSASTRRRAASARCAPVGMFAAGNSRATSACNAGPQRVERSATTAEAA
jgi:hypothetical protein